jgi:hypothetical protein
MEYSNHTCLDTDNETLVIPVNMSDNMWFSPTAFDIIIPISRPMVCLGKLAFNLRS